MRAARVEGAAGRRTQRGGKLARQGGELLAPGFQPRHLRQQGLGVWVGRPGKQLRCRRLLDDAAEIHHRHTVREVAYDGEVVTDEEQRQSSLRPQVGQQIDYLGLDRDVERADGLVAHQGGRARLPVRAQSRCAWRCPPLNSCGRRSIAAGSSPTSSSNPAT